MYTKLFQSILNSSIWSEDSDTCKVWITLLALQDKCGMVYGSVSGLARIACLPVERVQEALKILEGPDPLSSDLGRNPENEGRRIVEAAGGWEIVNSPFYRALKDADTRREQNRLAKRKSRQRSQQSLSPVVTKADNPHPLNGIDVVADVASDHPQIRSDEMRSEETTTTTTGASDGGVVNSGDGVDELKAAQEKLLHLREKREKPEMSKLEIEL